MAFPDFDVKDIDGNALSVSKYKGKIVLVDFWATWCGPCVQEMPNVIKAYQKYHDKGFEIIGISGDQDIEELKAFIKAKGMAWPEYLDSHDEQTSLGRKYGVATIPFNFLLDRNGKIIDKGLRGDELEKAVKDAIAQ